MITPETSNHRLWFGARVRAGAGPLVVLHVQPESPAARAGLCVNDTILQVNGKNPNGFIDFNTSLLSNPKKDVVLIVRRGTELVNLTVKLLPENTFFNADLVEKCTGLRLQELTPELANASGLNTGYGFVVTAADKTAAAQIQPGIFITSFDGRQPADMAQVARLVHQKKHGETLQLGVLAARRQGNFISYRQGILELPIR
jgi:S1-C subfamily serine protease